MDSRDRAHGRRKWYKSFDQRKMLLVVVIFNEDEDAEYDETFPAKMEVCPLCNGKGKHVNPSIDAHGISAQEFAEDPDFAESYFAGHYDVTCYQCGGNNVVPVIDEDRCTDEQKALLAQREKQLEEQAEYERISAAERRMGA